MLVWRQEGHLACNILISYLQRFSFEDLALPRVIVSKIGHLNKQTKIVVL